MTFLSDLEIASVNWASYSLSTGPATRFGDKLAALLASVDLASAGAAWDEIEEYVFSQGTIYSAAEPTISVMLAALTEEQPSWRSGRIMDLLLFLVQGVSVDDPGLHDRCVARARAGLWLLLRRAIDSDGWARHYALEVVVAIAPEWTDLVDESGGRLDFKHRPPAAR